MGWGWGGVGRESRSKNVEVGKCRVGSGPHCVWSTFRGWSAEP